MSHQARYRRIVEPRHCYTLCRERGCRESEWTFRYEFPDGADAGWLCERHAREAGFCTRCGNFIAGSGEETDSGMCRDCWYEFRADCGEGDELCDPVEDYYEHALQNCGQFPGTNRWTL